MLRVTRNEAQVWPREAGWRTLTGDDRDGFASDFDDLTVEQGDALRFEVSAGGNDDNHADLTSWSPTIAYTELEPSGVIVVQDDAVDVRYSDGHWNERNGAHEANEADASLSMAFDGTQVTVHGPRGQEQGAAAFTVCTRDGASCLDEVTVELFDNGERADQVLWTSPLVPLGAHTLRVRAVPAQNAAGRRVTFDYATISSNTRFINDDSIGNGVDQVGYHGAGWSKTGNIHYHDGAAADVYYLLRFTGTQVTVSGGRNVDRGIAAFSVCDREGQVCGPETLVDAFSSTLQIKQMLWTSPVLAPGEHAIRVRPTQTRNAASTGTIIDFDRAIVD